MSRAPARPPGLGRSPLLLAVLFALSLFGCGGGSGAEDAGPITNDSGADGGALDDAGLDAGLDGGGVADDAGSQDAGTRDAGSGPRGLLTDSHQVLFVGNSYTAVNRLDRLYADLAADADLPLAPLRTEAVTPGGYRWVQHAADARTDGTNLHRWLLGGTAEERDWDVVVLQEQSQIPGFGAGNPDTEASWGAVTELGALAEGAGAAVVLYMTWGRRDGDDLNPGLYPDFLIMQARLEEGYRESARRLEAAGHRVRIAPVGPAFRIVYEDTLAEGGDPSDPASAFYTLYASDGSHPSVAGSYLAASVLLGAITEIDPETLTRAPASLDPARAEALRAVAQRALLAERSRAP